MYFRAIFVQQNIVLFTSLSSKTTILIKKNHFWDNIVVGLGDKAWNTTGVQADPPGVRISKLWKVYWWGLIDH